MPPNHRRQGSDPDMELNKFLPPSHGGNDSMVKHEPRCKVCKSPNNVLSLVNYLLATGATYADAVRTLEPINQTLAPKDQISYQSIRSHHQNHLPYETEAIRRVVEKRRRQAYAGVMMNKGFTSMVKDETVVTPVDGLKAAAFLQSAEQGETGREAASQALSSLNKIIQAVRRQVPEEYWSLILADLEETEIVDSEVVEEIEVGEDEGDPDFGPGLDDEDF